MSTPAMSSHARMRAVSAAGSAAGSKATIRAGATPSGPNRRSCSTARNVPPAVAASSSNTTKRTRAKSTSSAAARSVSSR